MLTCLKQNTVSLAQEITRFNQSLIASSINAPRAKTGLKARVHKRARCIGVPRENMADVAAVAASTMVGQGTRPAVMPPKGIDILTHEFRVAFSFPGEARHRIGAIAHIVQAAAGADRV
jgi:hypothetical protein